VHGTKGGGRKKECSGNARGGSLQRENSSPTSAKSREYRGKEGEFSGGNGRGDFYSVSLRGEDGARFIAKKKGKVGKKKVGGISFDRGGGDIRSYWKLSTRTGGRWWRTPSESGGIPPGAFA